MIWTAAYLTIFNVSLLHSSAEINKGCVGFTTIGTIKLSRVLHNDENGQGQI